MTAAPEATTPPPLAASQSDSPISPTAEIAALLVALGLGTGAYFAIRARRHRRLAEYEEAYEAEPEQAHAEPEPLMAANEPTGGLEPEAPLPAFAAGEDVAGETTLAPATQSMTTPAAQPGLFVMPEGPVPQDRAARDALLEEMVAAPPDADNPFTSRKGRMRRARMILQAHELKQKEDATAPFDWRTYKPVASDPAPATPPRVTV